MTHKIYRECQSAIERCEEINKRHDAAMAAIMWKAKRLNMWAAGFTVIASVFLLNSLYVAEQHQAQQDKINQEIFYVKR